MVELEEIKKRQDELESCLIDLSEKEISEEKEQEKYIKRLQDIYTVDFRHSYSKLYHLAERIGNPNALYCLLGNIDFIKNRIFENNGTESNDSNTFAESIFELADHLTLEISRYINNLKIASEAFNLRKELDDFKNKTKKELENTAEKKLSGMQMNIVAIIGVFSGIAFAFSGWLQSFAEAFRNIKETPSSKLTFFVLLIGLVLFDIIYSMFYIIGKLLDRTTKISLVCFLGFNILVIAIDAVILNYSDKIKDFFDKFLG